MIDVNIYMEHPEEWGNQAENYIESEEINLYLSNLKARKNISPKTLAKKINYFHICELLCLYGQMHQKGFIDRCEGGNNAFGCRVDWVLSNINLFR
jgi:hypothetical protein